MGEWDCVRSYGKAKGVRQYALESQVPNADHQPMTTDK